MNLFLFFGLCVFASVCLWYLSPKEKIALLSRDGYIIANLCGYFGALIATLLIDSAMSSFLPTEMLPKYKIQIVSTKDSDSLSGSFTLGTGSINQTEYYSYYREWGNAYKKEKVPVKNSIIFEEARTNAELVVLKKEFSSPWIRKYFDVMKHNDNPEILYEFHVPKGTIIKKFSLE